MRVPKVQGTIRRRLLVNFRVEPDVIQRLLPAPFKPKLHNAKAIAGICLIRLENIRPKRFPKLVGISSENAAHRIAVVWDKAGAQREGVYIPRRDTGSWLNHLAGGRIFPGEHHRAKFDVHDEGDQISLRMRSADGRINVRVVGTTASELPGTSSFASVEEVSRFFEAGSLGYSATSAGGRLDGLILKTLSWRVDPLRIDEVFSSYFSDPLIFPEGSVSFDCALIMRNIAHEWHAASELYVEGAA
ncbi:MAG TPA: DUF2071 domain-containing protein [Thermoanaerobaculia bacterium]|nr:DUF2071 domain-containing protein [Thermoanaerobaculia bacterium]